jgi:hypothetical protein
MNREPNKEIDILLRKLSGKPNGSFKADGNSPTTAQEHLDADELNAYAEHALPRSLRARYTEHLADCSSCRNIVTQLSQSTTAIPAREAVAERSPSWLNTFLASLLSPFVIRYAVPAMAVIMIAALAWIVLRREPARQEVAQITPSTALQNQNSEPSGSPVAPSSVSQTEATAESGRADTANKAEEKQSADKRQPGVAQEQAPVTASPSKATDDEKKLADVAAKRDETGAGNAAPTAGAAAPPAPKEAVTVVDRNEPIQKKSEEVAKVQSIERRAYEEPQRSGPSNNQRAKNQQAQPDTVQSRGARTTGTTRRKDEAGEEEAEVRTVGGHRFTKREQVWVDTLYNSSQAIVNVARGSEQYRSLMGDEPDLRAIVERLSGEIIVVWKNRAYRFK